MLLFVSQFFKNIHHTGSVWPSSRSLARVMTLSLRRHHGRKRLLEVGPGTGSVTRSILASLRKGDELHIVEINSDFCDHLEEKVLAPYRAKHPGVKVKLHCAPIETAPLSGKFDYVICSLPFNNFAPTLVRRIFKRMLRLLGPGGELTYFEYAGVRPVKTPFVNAAGRRRLKQISATARVLRRRHSGQRRLVLANFPPAYSVRLTRR